MHTPVRGILLSVKLEFWGTKKKDSGTVKNKLLLKPLLTDVGREAIKYGAGHILSSKEIADTFYSQRQMALTRTMELVKVSCTDALLFTNDHDHHRRYQRCQLLSTRLSAISFVAYSLPSVIKKMMIRTYQ